MPETILPRAADADHADPRTDRTRARHLLEVRTNEAIDRVDRKLAALALYVRAL